MDPLRPLDQRSRIPFTLKTSWNRIRIKVKSWIRIRIKVKSWIRIHIEVMLIRIPVFMSPPHPRDLKRLINQIFWGALALISDSLYHVLAHLVRAKVVLDIYLLFYLTFPPL